MPDAGGSLVLFFGARSPDLLPYFGPLGKVPDRFLKKHFAFSRVPGQPKIYVQDKLREARALLAPLLADHNTYIYVCGLKAMEEGVDSALDDVAQSIGLDWQRVRDAMRENGRYHVETY